MLAQGAAGRRIWLWHRRLGHPSGYLDLNFPALSKFNKKSSSETCIPAKSCKQTFIPSNSQTDNLFNSY